MTPLAEISRRRLLVGAGLVAATVLSGTGPAAAANPHRRLVVIVARGGMDGLSVAPPLGDAAYLALRQSIAVTDAVKLDDHFALHPVLKTFQGLVGAGQARIAPAVAIPAPVRSHFDAQDRLEAGSTRTYGARSGWLNRALARTSIKALAVGAEMPLILRGETPSQAWAPGLERVTAFGDIFGELQDLYAGDPLLGPALAKGLETRQTATQFIDANGRGARASAAATAARFLTLADGPQVAVLSAGGFDTHAQQGAGTGALARRLEALDEAIGELSTGLGSKWSDTLVVVVTEFGRTARINGTLGTDHGTASCMLLAGGALRPGGIVGDWPTLAATKLFEGRDLAPTLDVRSVFKAALVDHLGLDAATVGQGVFPESAGAPPTRNLIA